MRLCIALALAATAWAVARAPLPTSLPALPEHYLEARLLDLTNGERLREGLAPVAGSSVLALAARHHAEEMTRLAYFSHVSPTPGRRDVGDRVSLVGGAQIAVGENLAAVSLRDLDVADRVIAGWMASPGHRANLLRPEWTHSGFGIAEGRDGRAYVVQVFAADPNPLVFAHAAWAARAGLAVRFEVVATAAGWVSVGGVDLQSEPVQVPAGGRATVVVEGVGASAPTHVRIAWTQDRAAGFIGQLSGWFDPASRTWTPDWQADPLIARVERYASTDPVQDVAVQLAFERPAHDLVVLVDGAAVPVEVTGTNLVVRVSGRPGARSLEVGVQQGDGRVRLVHRLELVVGDGVLELR
ncbi:MAG: CAP domain-containing protein [Trueperaceae bacterium]